ncbi:MAG: hypothetical protein OXI01_06565 [Albidovulum sp.]|nr:hypothetical protein [Albidovulum sp.]
MGKRLNTDSIALGEYFNFFCVFNIDYLINGVANDWFKWHRNLRSQAIGIYFLWICSLGSNTTAPVHAKYAIYVNYLPPAENEESELVRGRKPLAVWVMPRISAEKGVFANASHEDAGELAYKSRIAD